jgi:outer membrane protein assembly factor BamB
VLRSYRADTGVLLWQKEETERPRHLLAAEGRVYLRGSQIQAFDGRTGALAWSVPMGGCSPVTVANDRVYVVEGQDRKGIFAFRTDTGQQVWARQTMSSCSGFVVSGKIGYLSTQEGILRAIAI